jgi:hypothetical protein
MANEPRGLSIAPNFARAPVPMAQRNKKGHGTSLRRHTMTSVLKRDDRVVIPPSRFLQSFISATGSMRLQPNLPFFPPLP